MTYRSAVFPVIAFGASALVSVTAWLSMSEELAVSAGIKAFAMWRYILGALVASLIAFTAGSWIALSFSGRVAYQRGNELHRAVMWLKILTLIACICFAIIVVLTVAQGGSIQILELTMSGRSKVASIEGITTFVHAGTAAAVLLAACIAKYGWRSVCLAGRNVPVWISLLALVTVSRAFVASERVALYTPLVAAAAVFMVMSSRRVTAKALLVAAGGVVLVTGVFVGGEYFRSYNVKRNYYNLDETLWDYGLNRLVLYYAMAVNSGGAALEVVKESHETQPLFQHTINPLYKVVGAAMGRAFEESSQLPDMLEWSGLFNPEFNNMWGIAMPFTEGHWLGVAYWFIWGVMATRLWLNSRTAETDVYTLGMFGLVTVGLLEAGRANALATVHLLIPLGILLVLRYTGQTVR